jgi:hypothetical protein
MALRHLTAVLVVAAAAATPVSPSQAQTGSAPGRPAATPAGSTLDAAQTAISGTAVTQTGQPLADVQVQARNLLTGQVAGSARTGGNGQFSITKLDPGGYVLEIVDGSGRVGGTSPFLSVAPGKPVFATVVSTTPSLGPTAGTVATSLKTAMESVKYAAAAAGVAGVVTPRDVQTASPSR